MEMMEHANAITIHKSQGSECHVVIIPWLKSFLSHAEAEYFFIQGLPGRSCAFILLGNGKLFVRQFIQMIQVPERRCWRQKYNSIVNGISHRVIDRSRQQFATGLCKKIAK